MILQGFFPEGKFYKGSLHTHSSVSDAAMSPEEVAALYRSMGYDFLAITDHNIFGRHEELSDESFLLLPGVEMDIYYPRKDQMFVYEGGDYELNARYHPEINTVYNFKTHHIVGIGRPGCTLPEGFAFREFRKTLDYGTQIVEELKKNDCIVFYAHPYDSKVTIEDVAQVEGYDGMEIFNYGSELLHSMGYNEVYLDHVMWRGRKLKIFATDDSHQGANRDYGGGWIMVKAKELTHEAITEAIDQGSFYATNGGPEILDFCVEDGVAKVRCSGAQKIQFTTIRSKPCFYAPHMGVSELTEAEARPNWEFDKFCRVTVTDEYGRKSWSQPLYWE